MRNRIKEHRIKAGMTQKELADKIGISVAGMSHIETDKTTPNVAVALLLAEALSVDVIDLFQAQDEEYAFLLEDEIELDANRLVDIQRAIDRNTTAVQMMTAQIKSMTKLTRR